MDSEKKDGEGDVTLLLAQLQRGDHDAHERLFALVYGELRRLASAHMSGERRGHTLQTTALVNEAYLKLLGSAAPSWEDRGHFFRTASRAMRRILVDHARARATRKRGGGKAARVTFQETTHGTIEPGEEVLAVHDALERLEEMDPDAVRVVELRYFTGLTLDETAKVLGVTDRTVSNAWVRARTWLYKQLAS